MFSCVIFLVFYSLCFFLGCHLTCASNGKFYRKYNDTSSSWTNLYYRKGKNNWSNYSILVHVFQKQMWSFSIMMKYGIYINIAVWFMLYFCSPLSLLTIQLLLTLFGQSNIMTNWMNFLYCANYFTKYSVLIVLFFRTMTESVVDLAYHQRRVGMVVWHPTANNILLSAGSDNIVVIWNVGCGEALSTIDVHPDIIYSCCFNWDGSLLLTTCKDKKIRIINPRDGEVFEVRLRKYNELVIVREMKVEFDDDGM